MMLDKERLDLLLLAAEHGEDIRVSTHDSEFNRVLANLNVKESVDMAHYLYAESGMEASGRQRPNHFKYQIPVTLLGDRARSALGARSDHVSYDYLLAMGCRRCNSAVDYKSVGQFFERAGPDGKQRLLRELKCQSCGETIAPVFSSRCSDSFVDSCVLPASSARAPEGDQAYMYGFRQCFEFEHSGKQWWKDLMRDEHSRAQDATSLSMAKNANKSGREIVKQLCEKCGCEEAYYSTFQARSADEGMTVMYECMGCKHRSVVNT